MDDLDDLLDEVESKYCQSEKNKDVAKPVPAKVRASAPKRQSTTSSNEDNLDDIINDIISDEGYTVHKPKIAPVKTTITCSSSIDTNIKTKSKCYTIYVAGTDRRSGYSSSAQQKPCDQLHCTSCDNKIVLFDGYKWQDNECDYLVFRNNYPDFVRLKPFLTDRPGYRAYCCQCSWLSAKGLLELRTFKPAFKWICKKH